MCWVRAVVPDEPVQLSVLAVEQREQTALPHHRVDLPSLQQMDFSPSPPLQHTLFRIQFVRDSVLVPSESHDFYNQSMKNRKSSAKKEPRACEMYKERKT